VVEIKFFVKKIVKHIPNLAFKLKQAGMKETAESFVKKTLLNSFVFALVFSGYFYYILTKKLDFWIILFFVVLYIMFALYLLRYPDVKISRKAREVDKELLFGIRFLIIEIESGVPVYQALVSLSRNYKRLGFYLKEILNKVELGTSLEEAIKEEVDLVPSRNLRRLLWQVYNSIHSGSDLRQSLNVVLEQITEEEKISIIEYGRKLNPLAMVFLMIAIIIPSLGTAITIVLAVFIGFEITLPLLIVIVLIMAFIQFMFIQMIKTSRPSVNL